MTLKQVLIKVTEFVNNGLIDVDTPSDELNKAIACGNFIYSELADEYSDLRYVEDKTSADGKILFSAFSKDVKKILSVKDGKIAVPFKEFASYLQVDHDGTYTVEYAYKVGDALLTDTLDLPACFTLYAVACGVASEYFFRSGLMEEALFYKNRYDRAVNNLTASRRKSKLKIRRFI